MKTEKSTPYRLQLTTQQRAEIRELTGKEAESLELTVEELEERINPGLSVN